MSTRATLRVLVDFAFAAGGSALAYVCGWAVLNASKFLFVGLALGGGFGAMLFLAYGLPYGGAIVIVFVGLIRRRVGIVLGPVAFLLGLLLYSTGLSQENEIIAAGEAERVKALEQRDFLPLETKHDVIAVESDSEGYCHSICRQILAKTELAYAGKDSTRNSGWALFSRTEGEGCLLPDNIDSYLEFLEAGHLGICATQGTWSPSGDAIVVVINRHDDKVKEIVGPLYRGDVSEAFERRAGKDRLLGRWLAGAIEQPRSVITPIPNQKPEQIGKGFNVQGFFSALLGTQIQVGDVTGPATEAELLGAVLPLFDRVGFRASAERVASHLVLRARETDEPAIIRAIERLLSDPDRNRVILGYQLMASGYFKPGSFDLAKPQILQALASEDIELVHEALGAVQAFQRSDRSFAATNIIELAFGPLLRDAESWMVDRLLSLLREMPEHFSNDIRERARERIRSAEPLSSGQISALLMIAARNHGGSHEEIFDLIQSLKGVNFETAVGVVGARGWRMFEGGNQDRWSGEELEVLVRRAAEVPNQRLEHYVQAFSRVRGFDDIEAELREIVEQRLEEAEEDPVASAEEISKLERLLQRMP